jgi:hypothetical protein
MCDTCRHEVTITVDTARVQQWGALIGDPFDRPLPPVLLFIAADIHLALRRGKVTWPNHGTLSVSQAGIARVVTSDGSPFVYELFPARYDDNKPYEPLCYVGRWPD